MSQAEIEQQFQNNKASYVLPDRRSLKYLVIDDSKLREKIQLTPPELERYYNENKDRFRVQDRARVTHILLKTTDKKDEEVKQVEAKAQDLLKQVRSGKDFAELAKAHSDDSVSAQKGGEIGWVTRATSSGCLASSSAMKLRKSLGMAALSLNLKAFSSAEY